MSNYQGVANGTTWVAFIPPTQMLPIGDLPYTLFAAEQPNAPQASIAVNFGHKDESHPGTVSIEGFWSGDPGAFELDFQTADTDADGMYQQEGLAITVNGNTTAFSFRAEFMNVTANFGRLLIKTRTNGVKLTARITRN